MAMSDEEKKRFLKMLGYSGGDIRTVTEKKDEPRRETIPMSTAKYGGRRKKREELQEGEAAPKEKPKNYVDKEDLMFVYNLMNKKPNNETNS